MRPKPFELAQRVAFLKSACENRSVLHLGCTNWPYYEAASDGSLLHSVLAKVASDIYGIDGDIEGLEDLGSKGYANLFPADLEHLQLAPFDKTFDVIVAGEVIEHLSNPGLFLEGVKRFMRPDSELIVTTVNAYCAFRTAIYGLRGKGGHQEPVHPDHVAYYSYKTLRHVAERAGFSLARFAFYDLGKEHRTSVRMPVRVLNDVTVKFMPQLADGIIGVFRLAQGTAEK